MTAFSQLTYTAVLLAVLAEQLYLPIPSVVFLMAAGALSARGEMRMSMIVSLGIVACLGRARGNRLCASSWPTWPTASGIENCVSY
jgi:membrane protein DedA with SNARE-associated domain